MGDIWGNHVFDSFPMHAVIGGVRFAQLNSNTFPASSATLIPLKYEPPRLIESIKSALLERRVSWLDFRVF